MEQTLTPSDTIVAMATPQGKGAITLLRLSGPDAFALTGKIWRGANLAEAPSHTAHLGYIIDPESDEGTPIDQCLVTIFRAPHTFTGEDIVEFGLHGSPLIARRAIEVLVNSGARVANPGEFSQRAVINRRMSLLNAEATADLIAASSRAAHRMAMSQMRGGVERKLTEMQEALLHLASMLELELDFSEEDVEFASRDRLQEIALEARKHLKALKDSYRTGQAIKEGIPIAIIGPTNAGKSSLLNALVGDDRAIVSNLHGTTRDIIEDTLEIDDFMFRLMDTAGLRKTDDPIEQIGITQSNKAIKRARIVLLVTDITEPFPYELAQDTAAHIAEDATLLLIANKADLLPGHENAAMLPDTSRLPAKAGNGMIAISTKTGQNIESLKRRLTDIMRQSQEAVGESIITNIRHYEDISKALDAIDRLINQLNTPAMTTDILAQTLREAIAPLQELTGTALQTPALLQNIFSHFCIGK